MKKIYMITQLLACFSCGFLGVALYAENAVAGTMFICCAVWLAFKGDFQE